MSDSRENRKSRTAAQPPSPVETGIIRRWLDEFPARLWYAIGFVAFFFIIGGWNQLSSTWQKVTGNPIPGAGQPIGLLVGTLFLFVCVGLGVRAWGLDRQDSRNARSPDWKSDLNRHSDDIRFP